MDGTEKKTETPDDRAREELAKWIARHDGRYLEWGSYLVVAGEVLARIEIARGNGPNEGVEVLDPDPDAGSWEATARAPNRELEVHREALVLACRELT
ncbi:MAG: hypothetical protein ACYS76_16425, partial [Planctomycetota bacterium]